MSSELDGMRKEVVRGPRLELRTTQIQSFNFFCGA